MEAKLISSVRGKIRWLLVVYKGEKPLWLSGFLAGLLPTLSAHLRVLVLCKHHDAENRVEMLRYALTSMPALDTVQIKIVSSDEPRWSELQAQCFLMPMPKGFGFDESFCRDFFLVRRKGAARALQLSDCYPETARWSNFSDFFTRIGFGEGWQIEIGQDIRNYGLLGGNLLADEDFVLVGFHEWEMNWPPPTTSDSAQRQHFPADALKALHEFAGVGAYDFKKIVLVGQHLQLPRKMKNKQNLLRNFFNHIDTYLTLTGSRIGGKYVLLVAQCAGVVTLDQIFEQKPAQDPADKNSEQQGVLRALNRYLDRVARQLAKQFKILRNPVPVFQNYYLTPEKQIAIDASDPYYLGMLNNALVEVCENQKRVWLPGLQRSRFFEENRWFLQRIELENQKIWQSLDFEPLVVDANFHYFMSAKAGLHCLTNEIVRDTEPNFLTI